MRGRRSTYTPEKFEKVLQEMRQKASLDQACARAGVSRRTIYRWLEKEDDLKWRILTAKADAHKPGIR